MSFLLNIAVINTQQAKSESVTFKKILEVTFDYLNVAVLNQLIQLFRESSKILEPLLRVLIVLTKNLQKESKNDKVDDMSKDMAQ